MKVGAIRRFGPPSAIEIAEVARPEPAEGEVLVRVKAAGVGPWDALIREGKSVVAPQLPVALGSDIAGVIEAVGPNVREWQAGQEVYGVTNHQFTGGYAEYARASAQMIARKPVSLNFVEAASAPVVAVTAWQMLFDYAKLTAGQTALIHGGAGNVGAYAVQMAKQAGVHAIATASAEDEGFVRGLGAVRVLDYKRVRFEDAIRKPLDAVIDTVGGATRERSLGLLGSEGMLVSAASPIPGEMAKRYGKRAVFFLVDVTTERLRKIGELFESGALRPHVGTVLPLAEARVAHEMLGGAPHARGKIVLDVAG